MKKPNPPIWIRILRGLGVFILAAIFLLYFVLPVGVGVAVVLPGRETVGSPPPGFEAVTLTTADNVSLEGWYAPPANGAVIIVVHGAGGSREGVRPYAEMLVRNGYGVLALDLRGHGSSAGNTNRRGWEGSRDVGAAIEYLQAKEEVKQTGGLGISLGGEVLLGAAEGYPALAAIAADGATHRSLEELLALPSERLLYRNFTARVMYAAVRLFSGDQPPDPLLKSMIAAGDTRYLLIAGGANAQEVAYNQLFADTIGERASLWVVPDTPHTEAFNRYRAEYEQRVIDFFEASLQNGHTTPKTPQQHFSAPMPVKAGYCSNRLCYNHSSHRYVKLNRRCRMAQKLDLRPSPIAGQWYPGDPKRLADSVDAYISAAQMPALPGDLVAVMTPHAGHLYSGPVAGYAFAAMRGMQPDLVAVVSPMHYPAYEPLLTSAHSGYATPLGTLAIDQEAVNALDAYLHVELGFGLAPVKRDPEHSLEIELPFLQRALKNEFRLLPVMVRDASLGVARGLGIALGRVLEGRNALLVASTDLSHFYTQSTARLLDEEMLRRVEAFDPEGVLAAEEEGKGFACGRGALAAVLWAARTLGANAVKVLRYATSGDVTGDYTQVVGYGAAAIYRTVD